MAEFEQAYAPVRRFEGGWCDVPGDAGGETYAGVSRVFFPNWRGWAFVDAAKDSPSFKGGAAEFSKYLEQIEGLQVFIQEFYRTEWWVRMGLEHLPQLVANELFEQAVNLGRSGSARLVQRVCNAMNLAKRNGQEVRLFDDLVEDGALGPKSLNALNLVLLNRREEDVLQALNAAQGAKYLDIAASRFDQRKFLRGWMSRAQ